MGSLFTLNFRNKKKLRSLLLIFSCILFLNSCHKSYDIKVIEKPFNPIKIKNVYTQNKKSIKFQSFNFDRNRGLFFSFFLNDSMYVQYFFGQDSLFVEQLPNRLKLEESKISYSNNAEMTINHNNNLIKINCNGKIDTILVNTLAEEEFYKHSFYDDNIKIYDDCIYFQYGKVGNISYIDSMSVIFTNADFKDKYKRILPYPKYFLSRYIHYNGLVSAKSDSKIYYTFQTSKYLQSYSLYDDSVEKTLLPHAKQYLFFDTNKLNDILYIKKYSEQTAFNYRLFVVKDKIIILSRNKVRGKSRFKFFVYDTSLNFLGEKVLDEHIIPYNITSDNEKIIIINIYEGKIYNIFFN